MQSACRRSGAVPHRPGALGLSCSCGRRALSERKGGVHSWGDVKQGDDTLTCAITGFVLSCRCSLLTGHCCRDDLVAADRKEAAEDSKSDPKLVAASDTAVSSDKTETQTKTLAEFEAEGNKV